MASSTLAGWSLHVGARFHFENQSDFFPIVLCYLVDCHILFGHQINVEAISSGHIKFGGNVDEHQPRIQHKKNKCWLMFKTEEYKSENKHIHRTVIFKCLLINT